MRSASHPAQKQFAALSKRVSMPVDPTEPDLATALLDFLIPALIRAGDIQEQTILDLADEMDRQAQRESVERSSELERMSTALRFYAIQASGPSQSEWEADNRRRRFRVIEDEDGTDT